MYLTFSFLLFLPSTLPTFLIFSLRLPPRRRCCSFVAPFFANLTSRPVPSRCFVHTLSDLARLHDFRHVERIANLFGVYTRAFSCWKMTEMLVRWN